MADDKKYYWIKLSTNFITSRTVDFLMSQTNGANYVVLYQMLCLLTVNSNGVLANTIGEIIIPFDEEKIQRDTKYFTIDTVRIALGLYQKLGLIYLQEDGMFKIANYDKLVGSESKWAEIKRRQRLDNVQQMSNKCPTNVQQENRVKNIDFKIVEEKEKDNINVIPKEKSKRFVKPTIEQIQKYCDERENDIDAQRFYDHYESKGWMIGKSPMKDWQAAVRTWENIRKKENPIEQEPKREEKIIVSDEEQIKKFQSFINAGFTVEEIKLTDNELYECAKRHGIA